MDLVFLTAWLSSGIFRTVTDLILMCPELTVRMGDIRTDRKNLRPKLPDFTGKLIQLSLIPAGDDDLGTCFRICPDNGRPDTACTAGNDGYLTRSPMVSRKS